MGTHRASARRATGSAYVWKSRSPPIFIRSISDRGALFLCISTAPTGRQRLAGGGAQRNPRNAYHPYILAPKGRQIPLLVSAAPSGLVVVGDWRVCRGFGLRPPPPAYSLPPLRGLWWTGLGASAGVSALGLHRLPILYRPFGAPLSRSQVDVVELSVRHFRGLRSTTSPSQ